MNSSTIQLAHEANIPIQSYPPPTGSPPTDNRSGIHLTRDADFLIQSFLPATELTPAFEIPKLPLPYCAPQLTPAFDAPFSRGYNSTLESVGLTREQLIAFVDGLNLAMTASPPLRVVNIAGMVIGFVPYHWAMLAGAAIQVGAQASMRVLSKTLTDRYLRAANLRLFKPRGLSVRICTAAAMQHLVMHTPISAAPSKLKRFGRGVGSVLLRVPLPAVNAVVHAVADKPPKVAAMDPALNNGQSKKLLATRRRVAALEGYALPLDFDMPKPAKAQGVMDTMASWGVRFDSWTDARKQKKAEDARLELEEREREERNGGGRSQGGPLGLLMEGGRALGRLRDGGRQSDGGRLRDRRGGGGLVGALSARTSRTGASSGNNGQVGGLMGLVGQTTIGGLLQGGGRNGGLLARAHGGSKTQLEKKVADADLIEHWQSNKLLWVVIMNSEIDDEIEGIELAESQEDEEHINAEMWMEEMNMERQERLDDIQVERLAAELEKERPN
ncbi:hypothetical protein B0H16DRAFT_1878817 [Mycena metata]|uniref:Uncharacterized protein n=1 Tax=Mycena metata TaxID=1033252 RepID=A0AAD7NWM3_9AGAR|nr:hypothetical protein B0H16DRAFT_1878817 [Mycena metata]